MRGRNEQRLHAVLGAGPLGLAVARYLANRGDRVRAANRGGRADLPEGVEVLRANVADGRTRHGHAMERPSSITVPIRPTRSGPSCIRR
jgi:nucleoside-diphosphate-sugar epimerase